MPEPKMTLTAAAGCVVLLLVTRIRVAAALDDAVELQTVDRLQVIVSD